MKEVKHYPDQFKPRRLEVDIIVRETLEADRAYEVKRAVSKAVESKYRRLAKADPHFLAVKPL